MKRILILLITATLLAGMVGCGGTPSEDLEIRTWYDLNAIRDNLTGHHRLINDLDSTVSGYEELAGTTANGGKGWEPIGSNPGDQFAGTLDGQGFEIRDLVINRPDEIDVGLFRDVWPSGNVTNLGIINAAVTGQSCVGALTGTNHGAVGDCYSSGEVTCNEGTVGGLVGQNQDGIVRNSYSTGNVTGDANVGGLAGVNDNDGIVENSYSAGNVAGNAMVGGLVGVNGVGTVRDSHSTTNVIGINATGDPWRVGGLVGDNQGTVSRSYSTGSVISGGLGIGGLVGYNTGTVTNSFWDTATSGQSASNGGTGKTTEEMHAITTFSVATWNITAVANPSGRNLEYIWNIVNNVTYPFLSWEPVS